MSNTINLQTYADQMLTAAAIKHSDHCAPTEKALLESFNALLAEGRKNGIPVDVLGDLLSMVTYPEECI